MVVTNFKYRLSQLKRYTVVDKQDYDIGEPIDIALDSTKFFTATHIIIGGGFIEELLEELERKNDIDEIARFDDIERIERNLILLSVKGDQLIKTRENGDLPENLIRFNDLAKKAIVNIKQEEIGEILDISIVNTKTSVVMQNLDFNRDMRLKYEYGQRFEFIIPAEKMEMNNNSIIVDLTREQMEQIVLEKFKPTQRGVDKIEL
jgi:sporulation protein YlmC with PRC-barrel domain